MRRPLILSTLPLLAGLLLVPAHAQSKKELVARIVTLQTAQIDQMSNALAHQGPVQQMASQAAQLLRARVAEDKREATGKVIDEALRTYVREVQPALRSSLLKHAPAALGGKLESDFNEAELKQIVQALESPVLRRYNQLAAESQQAWVQKVVKENETLMKERLKALDAKMSDALGLRAAAPAASK